MAEVMLFHHAQGQTPGFFAFADELRRAGHTVHTLNLFGGRTFDSIQAGVAYAGEVGFGNLMDAEMQAAEELSSDLVYAGFSMGVLPAQKLAQTRAGAKGTLLFCSCMPVSEFGAEWPHGMDADPCFADEGDLDAARALVELAGHTELFLYPGDQHYFILPTPACRPTTSPQPRCSPGACSTSWHSRRGGHAEQQTANGRKLHGLSRSPHWKWSGLYPIRTGGQGKGRGCMQGGVPRAQPTAPTGHERTAPSALTSGYASPLPR